MYAGGRGGGVFPNFSEMFASILHPCGKNVQVFLKNYFWHFERKIKGSHSHTFVSFQKALEPRGRTIHKSNIKFYYDYKLIHYQQILLEITVANLDL